MVDVDADGRLGGTDKKSFVQQKRRISLGVGVDCMYLPKLSLNYERTFLVRDHPFKTSANFHDF